MGKKNKVKLFRKPSTNGIKTKRKVIISSSFYAKYNKKDAGVSLKENGRLKMYLGLKKTR